MKILLTLQFIKKKKKYSFCGHVNSDSSRLTLYKLSF